MHKYIVRRLLLAIPTFVGAVTLIFLLLRIMPGDIAAVIVSGQEMQLDITGEQYQKLREQLGLDKPLPLQYFEWFGDALRLDFGESMWYQTPVMDEFKMRYPISLSLLLLSLVLSLLIAIPAGIISAIKQDTWIDYSLRIFTLAGLSIPSFFAAILIILFLLRFFNWLPPLDYAPIWEDPWLNFKRLVFPSLAIGYRLSAIGARMTRSSMLEVMREDYVRTARAKGLRERVVIWRHALKNAILPVFTLIGIEIIILFAGIVIVETVFTIPGMGRLLVDALIFRDYITVQGIIFLFAIFVLVVNLLVDVSYAFFDPRIRLG